MTVNVELKIERGAPLSRISGLVERVAQILERTGAGPRVLVSSFHPRAVGLWMRRAPSVRAGLLFEAEAPLPLRRAWAAAWLRPFSLHPEIVLARPERVARWRRRGYFIVVWTVDDPAQLRACRELGVDAVITNDPARARAALA
jgi:glycerophosphoryl diester phosphodiesterase